MVKSQIEITFDRRGLGILTRVADAIEHSNRIAIEQARAETTEKYDDQTVSKVYKCIETILDDQTGMNSFELRQVTCDIISELQNAGILFRERA